MFVKKYKTHKLDSKWSRDMNKWIVYIPTAMAGTRKHQFNIICGKLCHFHGIQQK